MIGPFKWLPKTSLVCSFPNRQEILNVSQIAVAFHGICAPIVIHPDLIATILRAALVAENFRLFWVDPETHFFRTSFEFAQHVLKLFYRGCEQKHVVGKPQVREAVMVVVTQVDSHSFFLLPALDVVFQ